MPLPSEAARDPGRHGIDREIDQFVQANQASRSDGHRSELEEELRQSQRDLENLNRAVDFTRQLSGARRKSFFNTFFRFFRDPSTSGQAFELSTAHHMQCDTEGEQQNQQEELQEESNDDYASLAAANGLGEDLDGGAFETLKHHIYRNVAVFIACNEARPHFLQEIFKVLQLVNTDYLRERALQLMQDLLASVPRSSYGEEEFGVPSSFSEHTPSASNLETEDELDRAEYTRRTFAYEERATALSSTTTPTELSTAADVLGVDEEGNGVIDFGDDPLADTIIRPGHAGSLMDALQNIDRRLPENFAASSTMDNDSETSSHAADLLCGRAVAGPARLQTEFALEIESNKKIVLQVSRYLAQQERTTLVSERVVGDVALLVEQLVGQAQVYAEAPPDPGQLTFAVREALVKFVGQPVHTMLETGLHAISDILYEQIVYNKVVERVDLSYELEIADLQKVQEQVSSQLSDLRKLHRADLDKLQCDRWRRLRINGQESGPGLQHPAGPAAEASMESNDEQSEGEKVRDDAMADTCDFGHDKTQAVVVELTPSELQLAPSDNEEAEEEEEKDAHEEEEKEGKDGDEQRQTEKVAEDGLDKIEKDGKREEAASDAGNMVTVDDVPEDLTLIVPDLATLTAPREAAATVPVLPAVNALGAGSLALDHLRTLPEALVLAPDEPLPVPACQEVGENGGMGDKQQQQ